MIKKEKLTKVKGIQASLNLMITLDDLKKIKGLKEEDKYKSKTFKNYSDLLFNVLKEIDTSKLNKEQPKTFTSIEDLEQHIKE